MSSTDTCAESAVRHHRMNTAIRMLMAIAAITKPPAMVPPRPYWYTGGRSPQVF
jgi:hypothetical protein